ncbi:hypothetical protein LTR04_006807 [Oleoguttula sp. CCFEE 6159]|nr:hypothetical protein LTR04_006807 [Oleoguttula sp. CCFEE 6159]
MIGSLHLDADEEPRRVGATSRANSVRFDESANQGHWAHASRSSVEFIPRTGSGLGGQPMTERSGSHRSDGRASSAHSIRSATSGRANSLNLDSSYSLGNSNTSPLDTPGLAPGLFILGSAPSIIRCWMNTNFKHDSLLYAAVCTGSYRSFLDLRLIKNLGFEDQIERDVEGHRKLTAPVYFPEAVPHPASSRSNSPAPQLPSLTIEFIVIERGEEQAESKAIQIFVGSDVLRAHNADILFSLNSLTLFGDDRCKLSIPLVRPENEATFKDLYITSGTPRSAAPSKQHEQSLGTSALLNGATRNEQSSAASVSSAAVSLSEQPSPSGRYKPMGASSTANGNRVDTPSVAGSTMVHSVHPKLSLGALSTKIENREAAEPSPSQTTPSPAIWGSWRREGSQSSNPDWANANKRKESGMKVLKPKPASRILSGYTTTPGSPSTAQSRFFPEGRRTSAADNEPSLKSPEFGDVSNTANARESQPPSTTATKPRSANPVGSASAFAWLNSGASK